MNAENLNGTKTIQKKSAKVEEKAVTMPVDFDTILKPALEAMVLEHTGARVTVTAVNGGANPSLTVIFHWSDK